MFGRKVKYSFPHKKKNFKLKIVSGILLVLVVSLLVVSYVGSRGPLRPQIAMIPIKGEISAEFNQGFMSVASANSDEIARQIKRANEDNNVKAIILEINSPGGTVVATREIAQAVKQTQKPVISWLRESATSGAYWIASASDVIVADPATVTGSIGVTSSYLEYSGLLDKLGVEYERLVSGPYKDTGSQYRELTQYERTMLLSKINKINDMFIEEIALNRNMTTEKAKSLATGEIFLGIEAQENGLVDVLGGKTEVIAISEYLANISDSQIIIYGRKQSTISKLLNLLGQSSYVVGRGIGDSWNPLTNTDKSLRIIA